MTDATPSSRLSAAICALLFSSIMVLSAVGPARANAMETMLAAPQPADLPARPTAYLA